jgi:hypothetical protein
MLSCIHFDNQEDYQINIITPRRTTMSSSLYERLGATAGITKIANDVIDNHLKNKLISTRFAKSDATTLKTQPPHFLLPEQVARMCIREKICWQHIRA